MIPDGGGFERERTFRPRRVRPPLDLHRQQRRISMYG
jgi:hypothetical protein